MIIDYNCEFSDNQDLAQTAGNYLSDRSIDLGTAGTVPGGLVGTAAHDAGVGEPVEVVVQVGTSFASAGSTATVQCQLVMADDAALTSNLTVLNETAAIVCPAAGYQFRLRALPQGITKRYLGVRYVIAVQTTTAGKCDAFLAMNRQAAPSVTSVPAGA